MGVKVSFHVSMIVSIPKIFLVYPYNSKNIFIYVYTRYEISYMYPHPIQIMSASNPDNVSMRLHPTDFCALRLQKLEDINF